MVRSPLFLRRCIIVPGTFDPYHKWLGIAPKDQPPTHYRLLGIDLFESDPDVIATAADQRMAHVKGFQAGQNAALSQRILNELAVAKVCLLNAEKKAEYDETLRKSQKPSLYQPLPPAPPPAPPQSPLQFRSAPQPSDDLISDLSFLRKPVEKKPTKMRTKTDWLPAMVVLALFLIAIGAVAFVLTAPGPQTRRGGESRAEEGSSACASATARDSAANETPSSSACAAAHADCAETRTKTRTES